MLVATNIILSRQRFSRDKHIFVTTKDVFVATKMIVVAVPANGIISLTVSVDAEHRERKKHSKPLQ